MRSVHNCRLTRVLFHCAAGLLLAMPALAEEPSVVSLDEVEHALHEQLSSDESSDVTPAGFFRHHRDEVCPEADPHNPCRYYATCPHCQHSPCPHCPDSQCYRGVDHLGSCFHTVFGDAECLTNAVHYPAQGVHCVSEALHWYCTEMSMSWRRTFGPAWIYMSSGCVGSKVARLKGAMSCHLVNWRPGSVYLKGCIPEGYNLFAFAETVNHAMFYPPQLCPAGPREPGGSDAEAIMVEGVESRPVASLSVDITPPSGELPPDRAETKFAALDKRFHCPGTQRDSGEVSMYWNASLLNHQPLYFQDVNLDRHGFSYGLLQPLVSGARFFGTLPTLPYQICARPPQTTRYTLGETRPGSPAPYVHERLPADLDAAAFQATVVTGLVFLIP